MLWGQLIFPALEKQFKLQTIQLVSTIVALIENSKDGPTHCWLKLQTNFLKEGDRTILTSKHCCSHYYSSSNVPCPCHSYTHISEKPDVLLKSSWSRLGVTPLTSLWWVLQMNGCGFEALYHLMGAFHVILFMHCCSDKRTVRTLSSKKGERNFSVWLLC
jgi:hypothetical protein